MKRREFIPLLGGAAMPLFRWPLAARAQHTERMARLGVLLAMAGDSEGESFVAALREGLEKTGWNNGRNIRFDIRWGDSDAARLRTYAAELVNSKPDLIVA